MNHDKYFSQTFMQALIISIITIFATLFLSSFIGFNAPPDVAEQIAADIENLRETTTWTDIFINNFGLTLITFIPFFGILFAVYVQFGTGYAFGALSQFYNINNIYAILLTLATPVGVLEYSAYILAFAESITIAYSAFKKEFKKRLINHTWKTIIIVATLLLIGAIVEAAMIGRL